MTDLKKLTIVEIAGERHASEELTNAEAVFILAVEAVTEYTRLVDGQPNPDLSDYELTLQAIMENIVAEKSERERKLVARRKELDAEMQRRLADSDLQGAREILEMIDGIRPDTWDGPKEQTNPDLWE